VQPLSNEMLWGRWMRSLLQVHDELVQEAHPAVANYVRRKSVELMERAGGVKLRVPLRVDAALGTNWLDTKE
jgi:DNA polymerase I-like protein with 3'-5' exonuclease and polymerase domains